MFLRQFWVDTRLHYDSTKSVKVLELDASRMNEVWVPDLFISNEKKASVHMVTVPNKLLHIFPNGQVKYSVRYAPWLQGKVHISYTYSLNKHRSLLGDILSLAFTVSESLLDRQRIRNA